jgi:hypothetical protein
MHFQPVGPCGSVWHGFGPVHLPFDLAPPQSINSFFLGRPPHPFIRDRRIEGHTQQEADDRCESLSCLGDGLGHALAAMVGPAW